MSSQTPDSRLQLRNSWDLGSGIHRLAFLFSSLLCVVACEHTPSSRDFPKLLEPQARRMEDEQIAKQRILTWKADPTKKRTVGWFEERRVKPEGTREFRTLFMIRDASDVKTLGFATEGGEFFSYDVQGYPVRLGEWTVLHVGLKAFFGIPLEDSIDLVAVDPYAE